MPAARSQVRQLPVGVVGAIIPWNTPLFIAALKLGPALAAGCTVVLKPAPDAPLSIGVMAEAIEEAGLPDGVVNIVNGGAETGQAADVASRRRQDHLHRLHHGRCTDRGGVRITNPPVQHRTRWQVGRHRAARRAAGTDGGRAGCRGDGQQRTIVRGTYPNTVAPQPLRRVRGCVDRSGRRAGGRRPADQSHPHRTRDQRGRARQDRGVPAARARRGRHRPGWWDAPAEARVVRRPGA